MEAIKLEAVKLTHANNNQTIYVIKMLIAGYYFSPANRCTHVVMNGGAVFPAQESVETITQRLGANVPAEAKPKTKGKKND